MREGSIQENWIEIKDEGREKGKEENKVLRVEIKNKSEGRLPIKVGLSWKSLKGTREKEINKRKKEKKKKKKKKKKGANMSSNADQDTKKPKGKEPLIPFDCYRIKKI